MTRKPADTPTEFVPDLLKALRTQELSVAQLAEQMQQEFPHRVRRWADALADQGLLRRRKARTAKTNTPVAVFTLAKAWGGEVDR